MNLRFRQWTITTLLWALCFAPGWAEDAAEVESAAEAQDTSDEESAPIPVQDRQLPDISFKQSLYLEKHMGLFNRQEELTLLNSGSEEFFGLFLAERSGNPNGAVLILHDDQQHGHWPEVVAPLREYLPDYGWASLTMELPDAPRTAPPARDFMAGNDNSPEAQTDEQQTQQQPAAQQGDSAQPEEAQTDSDDQAEPIDNQGPDTEQAPESTEVTPLTDNENAYEPALPRLENLPQLASPEGTPQADPEQAQQDAEQRYLQTGRDRIKTAVEFLQQQKGQLNLAIIGVGEGAAWAIDYVSRYSLQLDQEQENKGMVIITVDPSYQEDIIPGHEQQMIDISVPFLELLTHADSSAMFFAKRRLGKMKHAQRRDYRQIRFTQLHSPGQAGNDLSRRIRGWLKTNASGTQVKLKD